jgi:NADPH:quinone reductase-like Zn-dependent oxidoreductase
VRADVFDRYGVPDVLRLAGVERPVPKEDEVLVKVHATTVTRTDCGFRSGKPFIARLGYSYFSTGSIFKALRRPKQRILGTELTGEVEAVGAAVREFEVGDPVFGVNPGKFGAHAEALCIRESVPLARKPAGQSSIGPTRWSRWPTRPGPSRRSRRPATSS